ncbi:MAG: DUF2975 domain-containing protein [Bacteroidaceae bacterium]|nr:DUF2975 domain-containing protein [Bacteroidaceae bacterium]
MERKELTKWLKIVIVFAALTGVLLCFIIAPFLGSETVFIYPELGYMYWPCLIFVWVTAVPFYVALYKGWLICEEISNDNSFCQENAQRLKEISKLALFECILYLAAMIILLVLNLLHPSILLMTLFVIFVGISIAVVCAALSHLVEKASELKEENDLTI